MKQGLRSPLERTSHTGQEDVVNAMPACHQQRRRSPQRCARRCAQRPALFSTVMRRNGKRGQNAHGRRHACAGFTYLALLAVLGLMMLTSTMTVQLGARLARAQAHDEFIETGMAYRAALISYARATPAGMQGRPARLEDLLKDPRYSATRRHLRKLYADPITGKSSWGIVYARDGGGIMGVHSLSDEPVGTRQAVKPMEQGQDRARVYRDWKFLATQ